jgi:suppressor of tumorigenicity protein 13
MGNPSVEVTEENQEAAQIEKSKAMDAISEGMRSFFIFILLFF